MTALVEETPKQKKIPMELVEAARKTLVLFPAVAAAFVWALDGHPLSVLVVIEDELAGRQACTRLLKAYLPDLDLSVCYEYWERWRRQDGFGGHRQIYLRAK